MEARIVVRLSAVVKSARQEHNRSEGKPMARTPLAARLAQDAATQPTITRRRFLRNAGAFAATAVAASAWSRLAPLARGATAGRVVVVGAGLAGLTCAYRQAGRISAQVYEAADRVGGRCWTLRGASPMGKSRNGAASSSTRATRTSASSSRSSASSSTTSTAPSRTTRSRSTTSTACPTRTQRRATTSTASTRSCTGTCPRRATPRCSTRSPSGARSWTRCRSWTGSRRAFPAGCRRSSVSC